MSKLVNRTKAVQSPVLGHYTQLEIARGNGVFVYDLDGQKYLDLSAGIAVTSTGHCHPKVVQAIKDQAETLIHGCAGVMYYDPYATLCEKIASKLGGNLSSFFLCQSGSEAVEAALKLARFTQKKDGILAFRGGFHGRTMGALSVTSSKDKYRDGYPAVPGTTFFPYPYFLHPEFSGTDSLDEYLSRLNTLFREQASEWAAVIFEPILGEGGYVPAPKELMTRLRDLCDQHGVLLILDEIQTGFGRSGSWFAFQQYGITPDIITLAKGMASGLPLGACVASPDLMAKWGPGAHGGTFGGNPISCAAGSATIDVIEEVIDAVPGLGDTALNTLKNDLSELDIITDIRGIGLMIGIEFSTPEALKSVMQRCLDQKVIVISCGIYDNVLRLMPALTITESELLSGLNTIIESCHELNSR